MARLPLPHNLDEQKLLKKQDKTEEYGSIIINVVDEIADEATEELDKLVSEVKKQLRNREDLQVTDLNYYITTIPVLMYYASDLMEDIGIKADSSEAIRREKYAKFYEKSKAGTIKDKEAETNKLVTDEYLIEAAYQRAYKKVKNRVELAENLLTSLKKVLQWRISELETTGHNSTNIATKNRRGRSGAIR